MIVNRRWVLKMLRGQILDKKIPIYPFVIFLFILLAPVSVCRAFSETWLGGPSRMAALGNMDIALPDSTNVMDLYADGFSSSLVFRRPQNGIYFLPGAVPHDLESYSTGGSYELHDHPVFAGPEHGGPGSAVFFLPGGNAFEITPYFMYNSGTIDNMWGVYEDTGQVDYKEQMYAADLKFARKITGELSGGASIRFALDKAESGIGGTQYLNNFYNDINGAITDIYTKADYSVSGTYAPGGGFQAALSFGSAKSLLPQFEPYIFEMDTGGFAGAINAYTPLFTGYEDDLSFNEVTTGLTKKTVSLEEKQGISGYEVNGGCGMTGEGESVFVVSAGIEAGMTGNYTRVSSTTDDDFYGHVTVTSESYDYSRIRNAYTHHVFLRGRFDFRNGIIISGKFNYSAAGADFYEDGPASPVTNVNLRYFDTAAGVLFLPGAFKVPIELFLQDMFQSQSGGASNDENQYTVFTSGARAGMEYEIVKGFFARTGVDFAYGGPSTYSDSGGDLQLGTSNNPAYTQLGVSLGAGRIMDNLEINLSFRYANINLLPKGDVNYKEGTVTVMSDVKIYL
jgi:hypothetical protein